MEHEEYAVLDRAGRLQIPAEYLEQMHVKGNKVKIEAAEGKLVISAPEDAGPGLR
jgi:formylmethanofuran dehydrogenase subunit D